MRLRAFARIALNILELTGLWLIITGAFELATWVGFVVSGLIAIACAALLERFYDDTRTPTRR